MDQIVLENVTKTFTTKALGTVTAVDRFNLKVKEGECFSFLGPSGCGKTTTLRMIAGFEDLSSGSIYLGGKAVSVKDKNIYVPPEDRGLGMVFQAFAVWPHMNIFDNVAFPLKVQKRPEAEIRERVALALKHCSLDGMEKVFPSDLSGGQQQRIALARAILKDAPIVVLDEATAFADPENEHQIQKAFETLTRNKTVLMIAHRLSTVQNADNIIVLSEGKIAEQGSHSALLERNGVYAAMWADYQRSAKWKVGKEAAV